MIISASEKTYISTTGTTTVFSGGGILRKVIIGTTAAGAITLVDGSTPFAELKSSIVENTYVYDVVIEDSLYVVCAATPLVTITWEK